MAKQTIGEFLATQRKAKGHTQQEVAERLGISNRTLSSWEQGRAYPDILTLPALAEIYGVTADEILNGERATAPLGGATLSEKAEAGMKKRIYAKYLSRVTVLTGAGIACGVLLMLFSVMGNFPPVWLIATVCALAAAGLMAVCTILFVFDRSACAALGIFIGDELTDGDKKFLWDIRKAGARCFRITGLVWAADAVFTAILFYFRYNYYLTDLGRALIIIPAVAGCALLVAAAVIYGKNVKLYGGETDKIIHKKRGKLLHKVSLFTLIPLGICAVLTVLAATIRYTVRIYGFEGNREDFLKHVHTVLKPHLGFDDGVEYGSYYIDFDKILADPSEDNKYVYEGINVEILYDEGEAYECILDITKPSGETAWIRYANRIPVKDSDELIFDFSAEPVPAYPNDAYFKQRYIEAGGGVYRIVNEYSKSVFYTALPFLAGGAALSIAVGAVIYCVLRRRV